MTDREEAAEMEGRKGRKKETESCRGKERGRAGERNGRQKWDDLDEDVLLSNK